jgi:hypothetical protein
VSTHVFEIDDEHGNLVDRIYTCSRGCMSDAAPVLGLEPVLPFPLAEEGCGYDVYCFTCGVLMHGERDDCTDDRCRYGVSVINLVGWSKVERCDNGHYLKVRAQILDEMENSNA